MSIIVDISTNWSKSSKNISPNIGDENVKAKFKSLFFITSKNISPNIGDENLWKNIDY